MTTQAKTVQVEHNGTTYTVKKFDPKNPPVRVMKAVEDDKAVGALEVLLGPVQFNKFLETDPMADDLNALVSLILGTEAGKSEAS